MLHYASLDELRLTNTWLAIGSFDGVHRGHQALLKGLAGEAHAAGAFAAVLTFHPHPAVVLRGRIEPYTLTSPEERAELMIRMGLDEVIVHPFDRAVAQLTARQFVEGLCSNLDLRRLYVGPDFALGRNREGDAAVLRGLADELGFTLEIVPPFDLDGRPVSSSRVRQALREGQVQAAAELLGRPYSLVGTVVPGDGRGRTIGIPTANLDIPNDRLAPKTGVYACRAGVDGAIFPAVTNIGVRPTFTDSQVVHPRVEAHLMDYDRDLYGKNLSLEFIDRLRDEQRFENVAALVEQIGRDIHSARRSLAGML